MKAYISKSNRTNMDNVMMLRNLLENKGIDILEYKGGEDYNKEFKPKIKTVDIIIVVPNKLPVDNKDHDYYRVGRGQLSESDINKNTFLLQSIESTTKAVFLKVVESVELPDSPDKNWQENYGKIFFNKEEISSDDLLKGKIELEVNDYPEEESYDDLEDVL